MKTNSVSKKILSIFMAIAMVISLFPAMTTTVNAAEEAEDTVIMQVKQGETVYQLTETEWNELVSAKEITVEVSANHRSAPVGTDTFKGVALTDIMSYLEIDVTKLNGTDNVTFTSGDGTARTLTVDSVFNTKRYAWELVTDDNGDPVRGSDGFDYVDNDNPPESPIIITSGETEDNDRIGRLIVSMSYKGEFTKTYWLNGMFENADTNIAIELPAAVEEAVTYESGTGTAEDPYIIANAEQLKLLADKVNGGETYADTYFKLSADIDLAELTDEEGNQISWTPIGGGDAVADADADGYDQETPVNKFLGTFDGNGKTIKNLVIDADANFVGLFGHNGGVLKNFTLDGKVTVTGSHDYVGAVVGFNTGTITRVINKAEIYATGSYNVGGIAGINVGYDGKWKNTNSQTRTAKNAKGVISECGNEGKLTAYRAMGGIVGYNCGPITSCYNYGDIDFLWEGSMSKIGGIAGVLGDTGSTWETGTIDSCYNTGAINWINTVQSSKGYGGITCFGLSTAAITNSYSIGYMKVGRSDYMPIIPRIDSQAISVNNYTLDTVLKDHTYYDEDSKKEGQWGIIKTEAEFKSEEMLKNLGGKYAADTNNINNGFPVLKWQNGVDVTVIGVEANVNELVIVEGQTFSDIKAQIELYAVYSDGTKSLIHPNNYTSDKTDAFTAADDGTTFTVSAPEGSATIKVKMQKRDLNYVQISTKPTKHAYAVGDEFDPTGMVVRAYYTNELLTTKYAAVTDYTWKTDAEDGKSLTEENNTVTVTYTENGKTSTVSFDVVVVDPGTAPEVDANGVYQIKTVEDLEWVAYQVNVLGNTEISVKLVNDIDASSSTMLPIGANTSQTVGQTGVTADGSESNITTKLTYSFNNPFKGTFDGNGKTVKLNIEQTTNYAGLIGYANGATVKNVTVTGSVSGAQYVGGVVGYGANTTVTGCTNEAEITATGNYAGGVAGSAATVTNCDNNADVSGKQYVGGIVGDASGTVSGCNNTGDVTATSNYAGGIAGSANIIENCSNTGDVEGVQYAAGVVGRIINANAAVKNSSNTGDVTGTTNVGGIAGYSFASYNTVTIENCYNKGDVTATAATATTGAGGLVGFNYAYTNLTISNSYNAGEVSNTGTTEGAAVGELVGAVNNSNATYVVTITNSYYEKAADEDAAAIGYIKNAASVTDESQAKTLAELSELAATLGTAYKNSCGGAVFTSQDSDGHTYGSWSEDNATFTESGEQSRTCEVCGKVETRTTEATGVAITVESIDAIGTVTLDSKDAIDAARANYDKLTEAQKAEVTNYETLTAAETEYARLVAEAEAEAAANKAAADAVTAKIDAIGTVTLDSKDAIDAAREAYNALTDVQKELVTNYETLVAAEVEYAALKAEAEANQAAADAVIAKIDAIGTVTLESKAQIDIARDAYDALTDAQKELVTNYETLKAAEAEYAALKAAADKAAADQAAADAVTGLIDKIGDNLTIADKDTVYDAKTAYDALTDDQKALISDADKAKLDNAVKTMDDLVKAEADKNTDADKDKDDATQTGDDFNMMPLMTIMILAAAAATGTVVYRRRNDA